ncbi:unnamed protein product [marine sediment metagenome]|uniref:Uncharacterized protein n=1 Tax=marine sediment metagenome TaxID=412755 RepID=X0ST48_9ZZZZ
MIDYLTTEEEVRSLGTKLQAIANEYAQLRVDYGEAEWKVKVLLASQMDDPAIKKASAEKQIVLLLAIADDPVKQLLHKYTTLKHKYKAKEKEFESIASSISAIQSLLKYARESGG